MTTESAVEESIRTTGCLPEFWLVQATKNGTYVGWFQCFHPNREAVEFEAARLRESLPWATVHIGKYVLARANDAGARAEAIGDCIAAINDRRGELEGGTNAAIVESYLDSVVLDLRRLLPRPADEHPREEEATCLACDVDGATGGQSAAHGREHTCARPHPSVPKALPQEMIDNVRGLAQRLDTNGADHPFDLEAMIADISFTVTTLQMLADREESFLRWTTLGAGDHMTLLEVGTLLSFVSNAFAAAAYLRVGKQWFDARDVDRRFLKHAERFEELEWRCEQIEAHNPSPYRGSYPWDRSTSGKKP